LDFETDSSYVRLKLSKNTANMVLMLNGKTVKTNWTGGLWTVPKEDLGYTNRITIVMSDVRDSHLWGIQELEIDGGCKITPHKTDLKMLFFGDSITEQFFGGKTASHYTAEVYNYFNADAIVQGNGCGQFWPEMLDPAMSELYQPDVIIVALGTNDYGRNKDKGVDWFEDRADAFLDKLQSVYPDVPIIGITPLRRLVSMTSNSENNYDKVCVDKACAGYAKSYEAHGAKVIPGDQLLKLPKHYNDNVHPNEDGHALLGANLCTVIEEYIEEIIGK
jgi:lysophospholipase L1-like esterase